MTEQEASALIAATEQAFASSGVDLHSGATTLIGWIDSAYPFLQAARDRETMKQQLTLMNVEDQQMFELVLGLILAAPGIIATALPDHLRTVAKDLPPVSPGRKPAVAPETARAIVGTIVDLYRRGIQLRIAQARAAQRHGVSLRTVQRVWSAREELAETPFASLKDMFDFLSTTPLRKDDAGR